jgi:high-affinity iron transporter
MLSTAIVIFRESLEISLIMGIVLAATRDLPGRLFWILGGVGAGVAGAGAVAYFADEISKAASGMGQEFFNAGILFTAAMFIGWTILWMRKHVREMSARLKQVGIAVTEGNLPKYSLSVIIALAMLREGSEIVLFMYGMIASGETATGIISGSLLGVILGTAAGVAFYAGLIRISAKYMLQVTSWILMLLVAGLAAQGAGFLSAAGYFDTLSHPVWDTSWLLSDGSLMGKALHSLIGYSAKPTTIQILTYGGTLAFLVTLVAIIDRKLHSRTIAVAGAAVVMLALFFTRPAFAVDNIYSPVVVKGEAEFEYSGNVAFDKESDKNNAQVHEIEIAYTPTDRWKTEFAFEVEHEPGEDMKAEAFAWENFFQFWEQGEKWLDAGGLVAYIHAIHHGDPDAIEAKLLLQKQTGPFLHRANIGAEQEIGSHAEGGPGFGVAWSTRYRYKQVFEPGFELQSDFGQNDDLRHFQDQEHYLGPAAYGKINLNGPNSLKYEAAYLFGLSDAAADGAARFKLEYEKYF